MAETTTTGAEAFELTPEAIAALEELGGVPSFEGIEGISPADLAFFGSDEFIGALIGAGVVALVVGLIIYLIYAYGLHKTGKGMGIKHAWLAWIPGLGDYVSMSATGLSFKFLIWFALVLPIGFGIVSGILEGIGGSALVAVANVITVISLIYAFWLWGYFCRKIATIAQSGWGMTIGLFFLPFIFFWIIGNKLEKIGYDNLDQNLLSSEKTRKYILILTIVLFIIGVVAIAGIAILIGYALSNPAFMEGFMEGFMGELQ